MTQATWNAKDFVAQLNGAHTSLSAVWPAVKAASARMSDTDRKAWNALAYVQEGMELQVAAYLRRQPGAKAEHHDPLGSFAGLPGGGGAIAPGDPPFAVPRLTISPGFAGAAAGAIPVAVVVGGWIIFGLALVLGAFKVTGVLDLIAQHWTATALYQTQVTAALTRGDPIPPPPQQRQADVADWAGVMLTLGLVAGGAWAISRWWPQRGGDRARLAA